jgi:hypothetical protein
LASCGGPNVTLNQSSVDTELSVQERDLVTQLTVLVVEFADAPA